MKDVALTFCFYAAQKNVLKYITDSGFSGEEATKSYKDCVLLSGK